MNIPIMFNMEIFVNVFVHRRRRRRRHYHHHHHSDHRRRYAEIKQSM